MINLEYPDGATPLDADELEGIKIKHITTRGELNRWEQENIQDAIAWLESRRKKTDILTESFIVELHERMFGKVWQWAGSFRRSDKNIGVTWTQIPIELKMLLDDVKFWIENNTYPPEEICYRLHHKLVWIHAFPNGNGRHSRMMADIMLTELFQKQQFTWGSVNLTDASVTRKQYINALRAADKNDYEALSTFVSS